MLFLLLCFGDARYCFLSKDDVDGVVVVENIFLFYS
jgi:hypothetical protein